MPQPAERDIEQTRKDLSAWLQRRMPAAKDLIVTSLGGPELTGFSSDTLMFDLAWREAGVERCVPVVVRLEPSGFRIFPEYDLTIQYRCMQTLGEHGVPVPRVLWLEQDAAALGAPFYVMERLDGRIPPDRPPYHMDGWVTAAAPSERAAIWWSGLDAMAEVHSVDWQRLDFSFLDRPAYGKTGVEQQLNFYREFLEWAMEGEGFPLCSRALDWLDANTPTNEPIRLCWGDARIGNQIFRDGRCVAVLDWEMATLGNPVQDLAWFLFIDRHHSEGIGLPRLEGFPDRGATVARWEQKTGLEARDTVGYYEAFAAMRFTVIMVRVGKQMKHYELIPADSDFHVNNTVSALLEKVLAEVGAG